MCDEHYTLKYEHSKFASITIAAVTTTDSGKYALLVKNKYGTEAAEFTVSVYLPEDEAEKKEWRHTDGERGLTDDQYTFQSILIQSIPTHSAVLYGITLYTVPIYLWF